MEQSFCRGDKFRTLRYTRATLELENRTYLSLEQQTTIVFSNLKPQEPSWLDLLKGVLYLRSRTPSSLDVRTPFINAAIKGTEFLVSSSDTEGQVTLFEGRVEVSNAKGRLLLSDGQSATAQAGTGPARKLLIKPEDVVQWALYYPPLIDLESLKRSGDPEVKIAAALYLAGNVEGALQRLERQSDAAIRAGLLLSIGRVDEARTLLDQAPTQISPRQRADLQALRAVIALAQNQREQALAQAEQATHTDPASPLGWIALSYVRQAGFKLEDALESARKAAELSPDNGLIQARIAELSAALGERHEARHAADRAVQLNPNLARAWAVKGFAQLNAMQAEEAQADFDQAIRLDPNDPLSHFGLGLAKIRQGHLGHGTEELEVAASLDPNDSLTRSYLGKAYYERKKSKLADTEYQLAKQFDPKDPTPWFYDAIKKQTENRPVEALQDMQQAIELNDNRAVYRSKQMLDSDLAARSAAQGRIYNDLGFGQRALLEGWKSVNSDPSDYSGHRFLADSYANLNRHEMARVSELLQSQLLQPINVTPVQPHLAESNLQAFYGLGPATQSFNEFNPLFNRDRFALQASGLVGSRGTWADEVTHSGVWRNLSYSLGQFHFETDGYRSNNRQDNNIYNAFVQAALTPDFSVQLEARYHDISYQDVAMRMNGIPLNSPSFTKDQSTVLRLGGHYTPAENSDFIVSLIYKRRRLDQNFLSESEGYMSEAQYQFHNDYLKSIFGLGYSDINDTVNKPVATKHANGYWYNYLDLPRGFQWMFGFSVDALNDGPNRKNYGNGTRNQVNPKLGLMWSITEDTILRLAGFRSLKRPLITDQTIEPTQVAGFNQFFDDYNATDVTRYGVGIDHRFSPTLFSGLEASTRHLHYPRENLTNSGMGRTREDLYRAYINWAPVSTIALSIGYEFSVFDDMKSSSGVNAAPHIQTHRLPFRVNYFHPNGFFTGIGVTYINQTANGTYVDFNDNFSFPRSSSDFALVDFGLGYRLPNRLGIARFDIRNILDEQFTYQGLSERTSIKSEKDMFYYWPERSFTAQVTLAF